MASGTYTATTLTQALALLAGRLMDPTFVHWTAAELTIYVQQALRTWNALTGFYRDRDSFTTTVNQPIYDLPTVLPALRAQTYTDDAAISQMVYHLLEPQPVAGVWTGTGQFTLPQVSQALQYARDRFLLETGIVLSTSTVTVDPVPSDGRIDLDESIANLRRALWSTADGNKTILRRTDSWGLTQYAATTWATQAVQRPKAYSVGETPPLVLQMAPVPSVAGDLSFVTVNRGATIVPGTAASLGVPNDWAWVVIFGAMKELLNKDGIAYDPSRAAYCQARWDHGVKLAMTAPVVMDGRIQGGIVQMGSLSGADYYSSAWPLVSGNPNRILTAGQTLVAVAPPPGVPVGGGQYTVLLDVVRNAPVPTVGGDFLQVGPELLDTILDYAQHLALFKEGTAQIQAAQGLLDRFLSMAGTEVKLEWALAPSLVPIADQTPQDSRQVAYQTTREGTIN
jgi:hypothetical protein